MWEEYRLGPGQVSAYASRWGGIGAEGSQGKDKGESRLHGDGSLVLDIEKLRCYLEERD